MADQDSKSYTKRKQLVDLARSQIGCHYVNGAAGNTPGNFDGAWYRPDTVKLYPNKLDAPGNAGGENGRRVPIYQAAYCTVNGFCVCGGRSAVTKLPQGDVNSDLIIFDNYKWPRPDKYITSSKVIWGESCEGIRHFDCIGFVNWCISEVARKVHYGIDQLSKKKAQQIADGKTLLTLADVRAADLLLKGTTHIAIATGDGYVVEASGYTRGVKQTKIEDSADQHGESWDFIYRLPNWFWN